MPYKSAGLGVFPIFCIMMLGVGLMNHVIVLPALLQEAKRDAWISALVCLIPYLGWIALMHFIMRQTRQQPIIPWLHERFGSLMSGSVRIIFIIYLLFISVITLKETVTWTQGTYMPRTPEVALILPLMVLCFFASRIGIRAIAIVAGILLPLVVVFGDFVMSANLPRKEYILLTPTLEHGWMPILGGCLYVGGGLAELVTLLLLQHQSKKNIRFWSIGLLGVFLIGLILGPVTGAISEFGPILAANLRYPAFEQWRLVSLGRYVQHVDFLSIYQWLSGAFVRISITIYLIVELITDGKPPNEKQSIIWLSIVCFVLVVLAMLPISDIQFLYFLKTMYLPGSLWLASVVLGILFLLVLISNRTRVNTSG
jgi:spore germination protein KB